jgi:hypothetical protein
MESLQLFRGKGIWSILSDVAGLGFDREKWVGIVTLNFKIEFEDGR